MLITSRPSPHQSWKKAKQDQFGNSSKDLKPKHGIEEEPMNGDAFSPMESASVVRKKTGSKVREQYSSYEKAQFRQTAKYPMPTLSAKYGHTRKKLTVSVSPPEEID